MAGAVPSTDCGSANRPFRAQIATAVLARARSPTEAAATRRDYDVTRQAAHGFSVARAHKQAASPINCEKCQLYRHRTDRERNMLGNNESGYFCR
jgi:hypothetical protein